MTLWWLWTVVLPLLLFGSIGLTAIFFLNGKTFRGALHQDEEKISAIKKIKWHQIFASHWIHGTGAWVLFAPTETGWSAGVWGVIAYAFGCGLPGIVFAICGPHMATITNGFSLVDWVRDRFGKGVYRLLLFVSFLFLFIISCAELTGLLDAFDFLISAQTTGHGGILWIPFVVVAVANSYAAVGGLQVSLITDRIEGLFCASFLGMCIYVLTNLGEQMDGPIEWTPTTESHNAAVTLILGCFINEMINQTQWQRVFSAKAPKHLRIGAVLGSCFIMAQITVFGLCGVFVHELYNAGKMPEGFSPDNWGVDSFFWGLWMSGNGNESMVYYTLAITCCIVCSTTDTLVNAYNSMLIKPMQRKKINIRWAPVCTLAFTLPAIVIASFRLSVIALFMTINVIAVSVVPGIFWGVFRGRSSKLAIWITFPLSMITVLIYGGVLEGTVEGAFKQFIFPRGPYAVSSAAIFIICLLISTIGVPLIAFIQGKVSPETLEKEWAEYEASQVGTVERHQGETALKEFYDYEYYYNEVEVRA